MDEMEQRLSSKKVLHMRKKEKAAPEPEAGSGGGEGVESLREPDVFDTSLRALGYNRGRFYYYSFASNQIHDLTPSEHSKANMLALAPITFWNRTFNSGNGIPWDVVASEMISRCYGAGVYNPDRVRGRGAWYDNGKPVLHLGDRLLVGGRDIRLREFFSHYLYEAGLRIEPPAPNPLTFKEAADVLGIAEGFRWTHPLCGVMLAGWCVVAPICGALSWRPHVWITGSSGVGKTTVVSRFVRPLLGKGSIYVQGATSEAGLRQTLQSDALPVLFDEAETNDKHTQERVAQVLELMRSSSSESGALMLKGSPGGAAKSYNIRSSFALVAINPGVRQSADHTRVTILTLRRPAAETDDQRRENLDHWQWLQDELCKIDELFAKRLLARTVRLIPTIRENAVTFGTAVATKRGDQRLGDQLGALLAGAYALISDDIVTLEQAEKFMGRWDWAGFLEDPDERDETAALRHIMQYVVRAETIDGQYRERSIGELVLIAAGDSHEAEFGYETVNRTLKRHGLRVDERTLFVSNTHEGLNRIFAPTPWSTSWHRQLSRLPFAVKAGPVNFLPADGGITKARPEKSRSIGLPIDDVLAAI